MTRMIKLGAVLLASLLSCGPGLAQSSVGGDNQFHLVAANSNNATLIAAGDHTVHGVQLSGVGSAPASCPPV